jgi:hypothetical protein
MRRRDVADWPASFRTRAAIRSLFVQSRHQLAGRTGWVIENDPTAVRTVLPCHVSSRGKPTFTSLRHSSATIPRYGKGELPCGSLGTNFAHTSSELHPRDILELFDLTHSLPSRLVTGP